MMFKRTQLKLLLAFSTLITSACSTQRSPSSTSSSPDYPRIFETTRNLYKERVSKKDDPALKNLKKIPESDLVGFLKNDPSKLEDSQAQLLEAIRSEMRNTDPTKHLRLMPPKGMWGYEELEFHVSHPYYEQGRLQSSGNLVEVWTKFLNSAQYEIVLNVFDFDLEEVADVLIRKARSGVKVSVGIDKGVIDVRPEVKTMYEKLLQGSVQVTPVRAVGLNHQKMAAIDWQHPRLSRVLFGSGNLTQSCSGPEGDLKHITQNRPKESVPNANHIITMKSWLLANLVSHELTKTLDPNFLMRGSEYPSNGAYQITGPGVDPETLEAYPQNSVIITFTPGGAYKSVGKNLLARVIEKSSGPIRMIQFAYSSKAVDEALIQRASREIKERGQFDFASVGDTPFAMQFWSQFLKMSAWQLKFSEDKTSKWYEEDSKGAWAQTLGPQHLQQVRRNIKIAPKIYGHNWVRVNGESIQISGKIHHKVMSTGDFAVVGTSFNFSEGAESNNEQVLVFRDPKLVGKVEGMHRWLAEQSPSSVDQEARRRNTLDRFDVPEDMGDLQSPENMAGERATRVLLNDAPESRPAF